jgi:hypothetical protein
LLSEFVWKLRENTIKLRDSKKTIIEDIDDAAYDLTIRKFAELPLEKDYSEKKDNISKKLKQKQVDCRNYYRVVLSKLKDWKERNPDVSELDEERMIGEILQKLVVKHYHWSRREFLRKKRPFSVRYIHKINNKTISLWYPAGLRAEDFRKWVKQNLSKPVKDVSGEQNRLQGELDKLFYQGSLPLDEYMDSKSDTVLQSIEYTSETGLSAANLAKAVASDKLYRINALRPAIKKLGKKSLAQLIFRIFDDIDRDSFKDNEIANDFGLSKATFSRFAGSNWKNKSDPNEIVSVPDLWKNTAKVIASDPDFCETAHHAGILKYIRNIIAG